MASASEVSARGWRGSGVNENGIDRGRRVIACIPSRRPVFATSCPVVASLPPPVPPSRPCHPPSPVASVLSLVVPLPSLSLRCISPIPPLARPRRWVLGGQVTRV